MCPERDLPEDDGVQVEGVLNDPCCGHSHPKDVLLCGKVVCGSYSVHIAKVAVRHTNTNTVNTCLATKRLQSAHFEKQVETTSRWLSVKL